MGSHQSRKKMMGKVKLESLPIHDKKTKKIFRRFVIISIQAWG